MIKKILLWGFLIFGIVIQCQAQSEKYTISGYVEDADTGEKLIAANVYDVFTGSGTVTNTYGFFSITLPKDSVVLSSSYIGYQDQEQRIYLDKDMSITIKLSSSLDLEVVEVVADRQKRIEEETQMSKVEVPIKQIKKLPALLGEVDVLKTIQLLPGVQSGGEGQTGLYVRGGSPDQNLILLDGVPVYNVSHLLGIFSVFNADAIKNVTLTKGGFPARYGGRLSSVLEINMKEGNLQEFHGEGSIGLITSKLTLEGPIIKDKTSFLVSARRTYADFIAKPIIKSQANNGGEDIDLTLYFYDLNAKIQHKFNEKHRLFLSAYSGADVFKSIIKESNNGGGSSSTEFEGGIDWSNLIAALRWNWEINKKLFSNTTLTYSRYKIDFVSGIKEIEDELSASFSAKYLSGIRDWTGKIDFDYIPNPNHYVRFGASATQHNYSPGALTLDSEFEEVKFDTLIGSDNINSMEYALYIEDDIKWGALKANVGVHASAFSVEGQNYFSVQPRLGLRYLLNNNYALKASFSTMTQYINLLTSESLSSPTDLWVPSTDRVKPQQSWQAALGIARTFKEDYEISLEGYYKEMDNVISFKEGASFLLGLENDWQDKVTQGFGKSYGLELFIQKKRGKTTGWLGYTLAWNNRQFDAINNGKEFPYRYDRRHDLSLVVAHEFTPKINASMAWIYGTGNAVTIPIYQYPVLTNYSSNSNNFGIQQIQSLGEKNAFRMSDYHRLDLSVEFVKKKKRYERAWVISVYNTYWHKNPYYIIADNEYDPATGTSKPVFKEISILPIIPSVSYKFKF